MSKELTATIEVEEIEDEIVVTEDEVQIAFTSDHSRSTNRDLPNQHPIKAINGLEEKLGTLEADVKLAKENKVTNIKTINGQSLIGSGNIIIGAGGSVVVSSYPAKFKGKRLSILGDSISTFGTPNQSNATGTWNYPNNRCRYPQDNLFTEVDYMYWKILLDKTGMEFGINESWAGSRVANTQASDSGDLGPNRCIASKTRIQHLGENGTPDVIVVYGGTNDIAGSTLGTFNPEAPVKFATLTDTAPSNPASLTDAQIDDLDVSTFANAYVAMLIRLQRYYPEAIIICLTPNYCKSYYGSNYVKMKNYVNCMIEICDFFGVEYIDLRKVGIGLMDMAGDTYTEALPDGIHPGIKGHRLIAEYLFNVLDSHYFIPESTAIDIPDGGGTGGSTGGDVEPEEPDVPTGELVWYTSEIDDNGGPASFATGNIAVEKGYGWAQVEAFQALIRNKNINAVKFISSESSGVVTIGKVPSFQATTGTLLTTKSWNSSNKDSNGLVTVILDDTIKITGTEYIVFSYGQYGSPFRYKSSTTPVHGFYGRIPQVPEGGSGVPWSDASSYTLGVDYGYQG